MTLPRRRASLGRRSRRSARQLRSPKTQRQRSRRRLTLRCFESRRWSRSRPVSCRRPTYGLSIGRTANLAPSPSWRQLAKAEHHLPRRRAAGIERLLRLDGRSVPSPAGRRQCARAGWPRPRASRRVLEASRRRRASARSPAAAACSGACACARRPQRACSSAISPCMRSIRPVRWAIFARRRRSSRRCATQRFRVGHSSPVGGFFPDGVVVHHATSTFVVVW